MANKSDRYQIFVLIKVYLKNNVKKYLMSNQTSYNNKRIAKNTLLLYVRMLFMMVIGLYTSRVILNALGVSDMGLMSVASSVITMFTFLNATLASGTQRFISFAIGENNAQKLKAVFRSAMTLHLLLAIIIFVPIGRMEYVLN